MRRPSILGRAFPVALLALGGSLGVAAHRSHPQEPERAAPVSRAELRQRFDSLTPDQKQALRARLKELKQLSPEHRQQLRDQAHQFEAMGRRVYQSLPARDRDRLDGLPAQKRQELLHEMALAELQDMGHRILRKLPKAERERLEAADPTERRRLLIELRRQMDGRIAESIKTMAPELGFSATELEQLNSLPPEERRNRFLLLVKRRCSDFVQREGLPQGVEPERWERVRHLPPDEFYLALLNLRRQFPDLARVGRSDSAAAGRDPGARSDRGLRQVRRALETHLDASERLGLAGSDRVERQQEIRRRRRQRAMEALEQAGYLSEGAAQRLGSVSDEVFFAQVRRFLDSGGQKGGFPKGSTPLRTPRTGSQGQQ